MPLSYVHMFSVTGRKVLSVGGMCEAQKTMKNKPPLREASVSVHRALTLAAHQGMTPLV